ncbi:RNA polymerase sigma factor [Clostridium gasigenes]|uniref:RNA polymerase sigma-70 factor, ECF subfamily n=1 Tax=Clostridium gasigenes TaxID=94869 RepID=A0A1H0W0R4_9CLOT|nr:RNA polymerase sigma factor [Clostridium gasigenes]SDP83976.1 RNA polymerase sigma-70 factor, ECF subfamily [Clostridium gasigenes]
MNESELIKKAKKGNKVAFVELLKLYEKDIYLFAKHMLVNEELIKDAVQETIMTVYEKIDDLRNIDSFKFWLLKILGNKCRDTLKRQRKILYLDTYIEKVHIENGYEEIEIRQCLEELSEDYKKVIVLYYFNDLSYKEISALLNISEGTVKSRLSRAKEKLSKIIDKEGRVING